MVTDSDHESDDASPVVKKAHGHGRIGHVIELCCHEDSMLGKLSAENGLRHTRITEAHDFTTSAGLKYALDKLHGADSAALLWVSLPCTGGFSLADSQHV